MAYNPTTWGSNDVITKDKLNKIEQGINTASKLSGTDIDANKDWGGKNITNMKSLTLTEAAPDALTVIYPSNVVIASSDTPVYLTSNIEWKVVKKALVQHDGVIRIQYTHAATGGGSEQSISSRISVDGWIQVTHDSTRDQGAKTYTDDIVVRRGREVVIEGYQSGRGWR